MDKLIKFIKTDMGKLVAAAAGIALLLLVIKAAAPGSVNICVNNGDDCVVSFRKAKKTAKKKRKKNKKN